VLLAIGLVVVLLLALGGWYLGFARYTVTPGILDLSQASAAAKLDKAGLELEVSGHDYSETVARGAVMKTDPGAGERIRKHGTVQVVISLGPERHPVPDVKGMTLDQAQAALQDAHLAFGRTIGKYSEKIAQGEVITADPAPGSKQRRDTAVDLVVSKGRKPIKIPDYTGKSAAAATKALTKLGFKVDDDTRQFSDAVAAGRVITQSPSGGTGHRGDEISLVVSKGPETVQLPDLRTKSYADAKETLEGLGLVVESRRSPFYIGIDRVGGMEPGPGSTVRRGSTVVLVLV
jgi:serine/threonine-protein kinase